MGALSKAIVILSAAMLMGGGANAAERTREARVATQPECAQYGTDGTCITLAMQGDKFCIADDRCSALTLRPVAALISYDARMDAAR